MNAQIVSAQELQGRRLAAEYLRLGRELKKKRQAYPVLGELWDAVDILVDVGTDLEDRRAVKRIIAPAPVRYRGNREAYNKFIELCIEEARQSRGLFQD